MIDLKEITINKHRLDTEPTEQKCIDWLNDDTMDSRKINLESLKEDILCMTRYRTNYDVIDDNTKQQVEKLCQNEEVVDIVLATIFQWFGSMVGNYNMNKLICDSK